MTGDDDNQHHRDIKSIFQYQEDLRDHYIRVFSLPENATQRLIELKLAHLEAETKLRELTLDEPANLERIYREEQNKYESLIQLIDRNKRERINREKTLLYHQRECEFFKTKLTQIDINRLDQKINQIRLIQQQVSEKSSKLKKLRKDLEDFASIKPTNEDLKRKIDELKQRRQSLDITFVDSDSSGRERD